MAVVWTDTYTESGSDVNLSAHTADSGGTYAKHPNFSGDVVVDATNDDIYCSTTATADYVASYTAAPAGVDATFLGVWKGTAGIFGFVFRSNSASGSVGNTYYLIRYDGTKFELFKTVAGVATSLGTYVVALTIGQVYTIKVESRDATKTVYVDAVQRIQTTDNAITAYNKFGYRSSTNASTATTGFHVTSLTVDDLTPSGTITGTDKSGYQVIQRMSGSTPGGTSASVSFAGVYTGSPASVQIRVMAYGGAGSPVVDWTTVSAASGTFSGSLTVPQGGWYQWEARGLDSGGVVIDSWQGANKWGVGVNVFMPGQSNMNGYGANDYTVANDHVAVWSTAATPAWGHLVEPWYSYGLASSGAPLGNALYAALGVPIGLIPHAVLGAALIGSDGTVWGYRNPANHADTATIYGKGLQRVQASGGNVEFVCWNQGAADAIAGATAADYTTSFNQVVAWLAADLGYSPTWVLNQVGRNTAAGSFDTGYNAIRSAHRGLDNGTTILCARSTNDFTISNPDATGGHSSHYPGSEQQRLALAYSYAILYHLGLRSQYGCPRLTAAAFTTANRTVIRCTIAHRGGTDFTPTSSIPGFHVTDADGDKSISVARVDGSTLDITCTTPCSGATLVLYEDGKNPAGPTGLWHDNQSDALPLLTETVGLIPASSFSGNFFAR